MKEWSKFNGDVAKCLEKAAKKELGIKIGDTLSRDQTIELTRLRFRCYYEKLQKIGKNRFDKLTKELIESISEPSEVLSERQFQYHSKFEDPRDVIKQTEFLGSMGMAILSEVDEALFTQDTRLISRMFILSYIGNIANQVYLGFLEPLFDLLNLANHILKLDADWATALIAVSIEEALVKKKLRELGYEPKKEDSFHSQIVKLVELMKKEDIRPHIDVLLTDGFRNIRNEIIHDPQKWIPKENEVNEIVRHTVDLAKGLRPDLFKIEEEDNDE